MELFLIRLSFACYKYDMGMRYKIYMCMFKGPKVNVNKILFCLTCMHIRIISQIENKIINELQKALYYGV